MSEELSLADELRSHLQAETPEEVVEPEIADIPVEPAEPVAAEVPKEEAKEETKAEATEAPAEAKAEEQPHESSVSRPPATWSATAKAEFGKLPDVVRNEIAKREADFSRGIQQYAEKAKLADRYTAEIQPYDAMFRSLNASPEQFMRDALNTEYKLRTISPQEKTQMLLQYAQHYGADLSIIPQLLGTQPREEGGQPDIEALVRQSVQQLVNPLAQKVQTWEQQTAQASQRQYQALEAEVGGQIEAFQNAVDESGQPKHLFFENVRGAMSGYIERGEAANLEQAYEMACYANNEVRTALIAQEQSKAEAKRLDEAKRRAAASKHASFDVSGQGGVGIADTSKLSIADEIRAQLRGNTRM